MDPLENWLREEEKGAGIKLKSDGSGIAPQPRSVEHIFDSLNLHDLYPKLRMMKPTSTSPITDPHPIKATSEAPAPSTSTEDVRAPIRRYWESSDQGTTTTTSAAPALSTSPEDVRASIRRYWESSDQGTMDEYLKSLETSIERFNVLNGTAFARPAHRPRTDPARAAGSGSVSGSVARDPYAAHDPRLRQLHARSDDTHSTEELQDLHKILNTLNDYSGQYGLNIAEPDLSSGGPASSSELLNHVVPESFSLEQILHGYPKRVAVHTDSAKPNSTSSSTGTHRHDLQTSAAPALSTSTEDAQPYMIRFWDSSNPATTTSAAPSTSTEDASILRFLESTDEGTMYEYVKKLEASINRSALARPANRPGSGSGSGSRSRDPYTAYDPRQLLPELPPRVPVRTTWIDDSHSTAVVRHKRGVQAWHVVIIVLILLAALYSYACRLSAKRDRSNCDRRQRSASNCNSTTAVTATQQRGDGRAAQAHDPAPTPTLRDLVRSLPPQSPPPLLPAESDDTLHGVMVERAEFHIMDVDTDVEERPTPPPRRNATPPRRAATPPPPYPGLPSYVHSNDGHCEEEDPPPPYQAEIVKKPS